MAVQRVEGVSAAQFSHDRAEGRVIYDTTMTSVEEIAAELKRITGFTAQERIRAGGG